MPMETRSKRYEVAEEQQSLDARKSADKSTKDREEDREISQQQEAPSRRSAPRTTGTRSSVSRIKKLEAQVKADQELARLLEQEEELLQRKMEHERKRIQNRLELEQARLEDVSIEEVEVKTKNLIGTSETEDAGVKVRDWLYNRNYFDSTNFENSFDVDPKVTKVLGHEKDVNFSKFYDDKSDVSVTRKDFMKFIARQTIKDDLPEFSGEIKEWPNFYQQFESTTRLLELSDEENVCRLRKFLKGDAKRAVEALLMANSPVSTILETLQRRFGRSDLLVKSLVSETRNLPYIRNNDPKSLVNFAQTVTNLVKTFEVMNMNNYIGCPQLMEDLLQKLPQNLQWQWGEKLAKVKGQLTLLDFQNWISDKAEAVSYIPFLTKSVDTRFDTSKNKYKSTLVTNNDIRSPEATSKCSYCKALHSLKDCKTFVNLSVEEKWDFVKNNSVCFSCLRKSHRIKDCKSKRKCNINGCKKIHNKLLHIETFSDRKDQTNENLANCEIGDNVVAHTLACKTHVFLKIAPVIIRTCNIEKEIFALFDEGSTVSLIDEQLADELNLKGSAVDLGLKWTSKNSCRNITSRRVTFDISGKGMNSFYKLSSVYTMKDLDLPVQSLNSSKLKSKWVHLRDIDFINLENAQPKLLLGQDHWDLIATRELIEGPKNSPALSLTRLGWVVHGNVQYYRGRVDDNIILHITQADSSDKELHDMVSKYFSIESFGVKILDRKLLSKDDEKAEEIMKRVTRKVGERWETGLLWKDDTVDLPDSKPLAIQRFKYIEKKMCQDKQFKEAYSNKIEEYLKKGYAIKIDEQKSNIGNRIWYLPHFGVINMNKKKPLRLVFDSAAEVQGRSLNDFLYRGPDLYNSLIGIIWKFREKQIAFSADIKEMFHQVNIRTEDQPAQRFLFRESPDQKICTYQMQVMIFGNVSSPYCAQYVKNRNALDFIEKYPAAVEAILSKHYMDDYLDSVDTIEEAVNIINNIIMIYGKGGFEMRGWISNSQDVMDSIATELCSQDKMLDDPNMSHRVLGLKWCPMKDIFKFCIDFNKIKTSIILGEQIPTKREVLKVVMSLFDSIGLLGNFTIKGKILLQDIWKAGIPWDKEIKNCHFKRWKKWIIEDLKKIDNIEIPRCYNYRNFNTFILELHIFTDSSQQAMAAVAYFRLKESNNIHLTLVMSRTQVAKVTTIPRLELQAAVMGSRLARTIQKEHSLKINSTTFWTDSKVVLGWIRSEHRKFKTFVANRIAEILESSHESQWRWLPTKENVADEATRWESEIDFSINSRWFNGPEFLHKKKEYWPKEDETYRYLEIETEKVEEKRILVNLQKQNYYFPDINKISNWRKGLHIMAYVLRFLTRNKDRERGELKIQEIRKAEQVWHKSIQAECYSEELEFLRKGKCVPKNSTLYQLSPCLEDGIICLAGRTDNSPELEVETKRPTILPGKHRYTYLLVQYFHIHLGHKGLQIVLNEVRQRFWIVHGRRLVSKVINNCIICKYKKCKPRIPEMGQLPNFRVTKPPRPFTYVGLDYFGPMEVVLGRKRYKRYGVLFTCLSIRAVHIELADSLTTDSAILALRRFFARRGQPSTIWSDNGTNLKSASKELKLALKEINESKIHREMLAKDVDWRYISPASPHMAGAWERMVRSIKDTLKVILKATIVKEEVLYTFLLEAEHIVNSRPLTYVSSNHEDPESLTPNHFLIGTSSIAKPPVQPDYDLRIKDMKRQWRFSQKLAENFWHRWVREYLPTLTRRTRWYEKERNIEKEDIVILMDDRFPRNNWPLGRILNTYPGADGKVRVVEIKTKTGTYRRPVTKICPIDLLEMSNI